MNKLEETLRTIQRAAADTNDELLAEELDYAADFLEALVKMLK